MKSFFEDIYFTSVHLYETSFDILEEDSELRGLFNKYNIDFFDGNLDVDKIGWSSRKSQHMGASCRKDYAGNTWIEINPLLKNYPNKDAFRDLIVHEMIHLMYYNHDDGFQRKMNELNKKFGLHVSIYAEGEILKSLQNFSREKLETRADKINNNVNKPELQEVYDKLNNKYFEGKLPSNTIIKYLPTKTFKTYSLSQVRADVESDWIFEINVSKQDTEKNILPALIYIYVIDVLKTPKKDVNNKVKEFESKILQD